MSRYIDADALIKRLQYFSDWCRDGRKQGVDFCMDVIGDSPTADVVEVVRCRDCKWYGIDELKKDGSLDRRYKPSVCYLYREHHEESWYCADAERRTE